MLGTAIKHCRKIKSFYLFGISKVERILSENIFYGYWPPCIWHHKQRPHRGKRKTYHWPTVKCLLVHCLNSSIAAYASIHALSKSAIIYRQNLITLKRDWHRFFFMQDTELDLRDATPIMIIKNYEVPSQYFNQSTIPRRRKMQQLKFKSEPIVIMMTPSQHQKLPQVRTSLHHI